jgi:hypothetical protein
MNCTNHTDTDATGTCVYCGKPFCGECVVEVKGKLYCKPDLGNVVDELEEKGNQAAPTVFMNAGGGGGGSSSSAAAASSGAGAGVLVPTKSKGLAGLLALFLGGFGIHKFYLGRTGMGILYLLLCWTFVPAISVKLDDRFPARSPLHFSINHW